MDIETITFEDETASVIGQKIATKPRTSVISYQNEFYIKAIVREIDMTLIKENGDALILPCELWNDLLIEMPVIWRRPAPIIFLIDGEIK